MDEVPFAGQLTETDFRRVQALAAKGVVQAFGILLAGLVTFLFWRWGWESIVACPLDAAMLFLPLILVLPLSVAIRPLAWRRYWRRSKVLQRPISGAASAEGITWATEGLGSNTLPWSMLQRFRASDSLVLVYTSPNQFLYFFPHYFAGDSEWQQFRALVASKLPRK